MKKLLLIVDPQVDFITGTLPVGGAAEAMDALATYVKEHGDEYIVKIATSDWHPYHHCSFADDGLVIVCNIRLVQQSGSRYWLLLTSQRVASPYYIRVIALIRTSILSCKIMRQQIFSLG